MSHQFVIWRDVPVLTKIRGWHKRHKVTKPSRYAFYVDCGDVPVGRFNEITRVFEQVVNHRGNAYAARKRQMYRKKEDKWNNV